MEEWYLDIGYLTGGLSDVYGFSHKSFFVQEGWMFFEKYGISDEFFMKVHGSGLGIGINDKYDVIFVPEYSGICLYWNCWVG